MPTAPVAPMNVQTPASVNPALALLLQQLAASPALPTGVALPAIQPHGIVQIAHLQQLLALNPHLAQSLAVQQPVIQVPVLQVPLVDPTLLAHNLPALLTTLAPQTQPALGTIPSAASLPVRRIASPAAPLHAIITDQSSTDQDVGPTGRPPVMLSLASDPGSVSEYQCLVRQQIEFFEATQEDVQSNAQGRNRPIVLAQVGIRCRHCVDLPQSVRGRGAVYFPSRLDGIYQASQNMSAHHLCELCSHIPEGTRSKLLALKDNNKSSSGGGKGYWSNGARQLGVIEDRTIGLRFENR